MELAITNTYFVKKPAHRVTYNSGGRSSQMDYIMVRRRRIKKVTDRIILIFGKFILFSFSGNDNVYST